MNEPRPHSEIEAEHNQYPFGKTTPYKPGHKNYLEQNDPPLTSHSTQGHIPAFVRKFGFPIIFLIIALSVLVVDGMNKSTVIMVGAWGLLMAIPWYFSTRDRDRPPSTFEKIAAGCWLWFRRIICCGVGILMVVAALAYGADAPFLASVGVFVLGLYAIYAGWFGQGNNESAFNDDLALHRQNKKRYRWRL